MPRGRFTAGSWGICFVSPQLVTDQKPKSEKKIDSCTTLPALPALGCGRAPGVRSLHRCVWQTFGIVREDSFFNLKPSTSSTFKKTKDAAVVRFVPPARQVKLRKGWLIPLILAASWRRASNFPMRSSNLGDSAALALHPCSHTSKLQKLTQGKGTIE